MVTTTSELASMHISDAADKLSKEVERRLIGANASEILDLSLSLKYAAEALVALNSVDRK